jgi:hypothetical protein
VSFVDGERKNITKAKARVAKASAQRITVEIVTD